MSFRVRFDLILKKPELREQFEKELAAHAEESNAHFTPEEKQALFAKIDELGIKVICFGERLQALNCSASASACIGEWRVPERGFDRMV
jgi:hypothetical protein